MVCYPHIIFCSFFSIASPNLLISHVHHPTQMSQLRRANQEKLPINDRVDFHLGAPSDRLSSTEPSSSRPVFPPCLPHCTTAVPNVQRALRGIILT